MSDARTRDSVRRTVLRAARRLRAQRLLAELGPAACAGLLGPALALLLPGGSLRSGLAVLTPLLAAAWLGWRALRPLPAERAAGWLDRRAGLADALTTACWFLDHEREDAWVEHQRRLADEASRELDLQQLVALRVPPGPALVAAALALVVLFGWRGAPGTPAANALARLEAEEPAPETGEEEPLPQAEALAGRDSVPEARPVAADLEALAEELRAGLSEEAREKLRELARQAEARRPPDADAATSGEGSSEEAAAEALSAEEMAAALAEASEAMQRGDQEAAAEALEEAAEAAEGQQQASSPEASAQQSQAAAQDETAARAPADAGVRWSLDALDPETLGGEKSEQAARGDAAGPPSASDPEEGEATDIDVELEREALSSESARETEPTEITEEASREQSARVGYRGGPGAGRYDAARPLETAEVPWSARERVRRYLLALTQEEPQR